ncbi:MAG: response regulator [Calditrichales bacterium]|nr:response regulator [Calditrichales bacterium]
MENTKRILIVDDDIDVLTVIKTILENEGHQIITAKDKNEAIEKAKAEKPNLAICDVMMTTHYEGFELAEVLTNDEEFKGMPVLMQTSIEVFSSQNDDAMTFARQYREKMNSKDMEVLLVENAKTLKAGVDYRTEDGKIKWLPVDGFIRKPVKAKTLIEAVNRVL